MSKVYPNYQNKNFYDYIQYIKENENFFEKIRITKSIVDDNCPESLNYFKKSGKLHKYYTYVRKFLYFYLYNRLFSDNLIIYF